MKSEWQTKTLKWLRHSWIEIGGRDCSITLEKRPAYCDRGNYIAKLFPIGKLVMEMDLQDGWPRYYFDQDRAKLECEAWLKKRKRWVE